MNNEFLKRIQTLIPQEYEQFLASLDQEVKKAMRINQIKASDQQVLSHIAHKEANPFVSHSWIVNQSLGLDPYHICGAIYLQEPSASAVVKLLDIKEDDFVLDLCAAPGSKTTQIAEKLKDGMLVSNEIEPKRAQVLLSNLERMGVTNFMVTNEDPKGLARAFPACFDKILVDAPCSGEGMIKKHEIIQQEWSYENILYCAKRQKEILTQAISMLKGQGILVYSTCTYAKEENEDIVAWVLENFEEMEQVECDVKYGRQGFDTEGMDASRVRRIFPMDGGEGQFMAKFRKKGTKENSVKTLKNEMPNKTEKNFLNDQLDIWLPYFMHHKEKLYMMDHPFLDVKKVKVVRQGVLVGEMKKNRFEPAHALYLNGLLKNHFRHTIACTIDQMDELMHGNQISIGSDSGYVALSYRGMPFGFGKSDGSRINNKIPKGLRLLPNSHVRKEEKNE